MNFAVIWLKGFNDIFKDFDSLGIVGSSYFELYELFAKWYGHIMSQNHILNIPVDKNRNVSDKSMALIIQ